MKCWIKTEKIKHDIEIIAQQLVWCSNQWQDKNEIQNDYMWMHEYAGDFAVSCVDGKILEQVLAIIMIMNITQINNNKKY